MRISDDELTTLSLKDSGLCRKKMRNGRTKAKNSNAADIRAAVHERGRGADAGPADADAAQRWIRCVAGVSGGVV